MNLLLARRRLMSKQAVPIPHKELYAIETTGTQYSIIEEFTPVYETDEIRFRFTSTANTLSIMCGCRTSGSTDDNYIVVSNEAYGYCGFGGRSFMNAAMKSNLLDIHEVIMNKDGVWLDGVKQTWYASSKKDGVLPFALCGALQSSGMDVRKQSGIFYEWEFKREGKTIHHIKPVQMNEDGTVQWYDEVNKKYYPSLLNSYIGISAESVAASLNELGVISTGNVDDDMIALREMGVTS